MYVLKYVLHCFLSLYDIICGYTIYCQKVFQSFYYITVLYLVFYPGHEYLLYHYISKICTLLLLLLIYVLNRNVKQLQYLYASQYCDMIILNVLQY